MVTAGVITSECCPHCGASVEIVAEASGQSMDCPGCGQAFLPAAWSVAPVANPDPSVHLASVTPPLARVLPVVLPASRLTTPCPCCDRVLSISATFCPGCGCVVKTGPSVFRIFHYAFWGTLGVVLTLSILGALPSLLVLGLMSGAGDKVSRQTSQATTTGGFPSAGHALEVVSFQPRTDSVEGVVSNRSSLGVAGVAVEFRLLDKADRSVGLVSDRIESLPGHAAWKFRCPIFGDAYDKARVESVGARGWAVD